MFDPITAGPFKLYLHLNALEKAATLNSQVANEIFDQDPKDPRLPDLYAASFDLLEDIIICEQLFHLLVYQDTI